MTRSADRRQFLQASAATALTASLAWADDKKAVAEDGVRVGIIGVAGQGAYNLGEIAKGGAKIVALCDVDENRAVKPREQFPEAKFYTDFRKLLENKELQAVAISTPDHTHAVAAVAALKAGLHVYCEKPLTRTVSEARIVRETAAKQKRITQMGTQIHAGDNYRRVVEVIQSGAIGPVHEVHVWVDTSYDGKERPKETPPVPAGLHYDLWLGPVEERPYSPKYIPFWWRGFWAFGGGTLADMACHYMDLPFWALKLTSPRKVAAEGPPVNPEGTPAWGIVYYDYPARESLPPVKLTWYHGGRRPHLYQDELPKWGGGVLFVGEKGLLAANYSTYKLMPESKFKDFTPPPQTIAKSVGHHREWLEAIKSGGATTCRFDYSGRLTEAVLLGNVSYRLGKPITWDSKNLKAVNEPGADKFLQHEYRAGWSL